MVDYGRVRSTVKPASMEITATKVFLNKDITEVEAEDGVQYEFTFMEYDKDEFILNQATLTSDLEDAICELAEIIGG